MAPVARSGIAADVSALETIRRGCLKEFTRVEAGKLWVSNQRADGSFDDLDYRGEPGGKFHLPQVYGRLFSMAQAWVSADSPLAGDPNLSNRIRLGLLYAAETPLVKKRPGDTVFWRRQVFLEPGRLGPLLSLVAGRLDGASLKGTMALAKACTSPPFQPTGSPLLEHCMARFYYAAAFGDLSSLDRLRAELEGLLQPGGDADRGGIQADGSWLLSGPVMDLGGEGLFWAEQLARFVRLADGSPAQISPRARTNLDLFLHQGASWVLASPALRVAFRRSQTAPFPPLDASLLSGFTAPPEGVRAFTVGDGVAYRSGDFYFGVRMASRRTHPWDFQPGDEEGPWHGADGATWFGAFQEPMVLSGFDWKRVPGTTVIARPGRTFLQSPTRPERPFAPFAGALAFGASGVAGLMLDSRDEVSPNTGLSANKAWFFFPNRSVLCLGHGIHSVLTNRVETVVDQRMAATDAAPGFPGEGMQILDGTQTITAGSLSYFFPSGGRLRGSVNGGKDASAYALWFDHGPRASNASYAYGILQNAGADELKRAVEGKSLRILSHTSRAMAVRDERSGETGYAFFAPGEVDDFSAARPCLAWAKQDGNLRTIRVCDPAQVREDLTIRLRGLWKAVDLPPKCSLKRTPGGVIIRMAATNGLPITATFLENTNWPPTAADESKPRR
jgi:hypothetical protein